ncbi:MAG: hypothetical protein U9Q92_01045 [archaeon]|nr:hypothetical protein [archaeon]
MKFKLFGRLMKKKHEPASQVQTEKRDPHIIINELTAKGLPESEIIRTLKDEGYSFKEIDDALNESVRNEVTGAPPMMDSEYGAPDPGQQFPEAPDTGGMPGQSSQDQYLDKDLTNMDRQDLNLVQKPAQFTDSTNMVPPGEGLGQASTMSMPEDDRGQQGQATLDDRERENIYEVVESVVNERVNSLKSDIKEIDAQIKSIQQIISEFKSEVQEQQDAWRKEFGSTHESIKDNTSNIMDIEPRVAGLEKAFKDIVPNLVDSVREVKELVSGHRGDIGIEQAGSAASAPTFDESENDAGRRENPKTGESPHEPENIFIEPGIDDIHSKEPTDKEPEKEKEHLKTNSAKDKEDKEPIFDESDDDERI